MAVSSTKSETTKKPSSAPHGQPAQRSQSSRKGKRAWRKNVDIDAVEEGLEELRVEERVIGTTLQKQTDDQLFQVDVQGDDNIRKRLPKFSERVLTSTKILSERSAVPAVFSRTAEKRKAAASLTHEEKGRLLRMGKKLKRGPFNAVIDPTQVGEGSAILELSEAAKSAGAYDVWASEALRTVKKPQTQHPRSVITVPAVPAPHEGSSYNPPLTAHQELLRAAHEIEERKLEDAEELEALKAKLEKARALRVAIEHAAEDLAPGMTLDVLAPPAEDDAQEEGEVLPPKKVPAKKTKQQRRKAEKLKAEKRALTEKAARKRMLSAVDAAKSLRKSLSRNLATRERLRAQRLLEEQEKLKSGLTGQKIGKHTVPEGAVDVQLGEELSESLRALKPEGNLFRDRFVSMQQRALVEPRVPVMPKKRKLKFKEYEKHPWKRFDREQGYNLD